MTILPICPPVLRRPALVLALALAGSAPAPAQIRITERAAFPGVGAIASGGFYDSTRNLLVVSSLGELREWDRPGAARSWPMPAPVQAVVCGFPHPSEPGGGLVWNAQFGTWLYRGGDWYLIAAAGTPIPANAMVFRQRAVLDTARNRAMLLVEAGGTSAFEFDGFTWSPIPVPPGNDLFGGMVYDPVRGRVMVLTDFGAYLYNPNGTWTPTAAPPWPYVFDRALAWDAARQRIVAFGGYQFVGWPQLVQPNNQTLEWDGTAWNVISPPTTPSPRSGATLLYDALTRRCVLFGGDTALNQTSDEVWSWNGTDWSNLSASTTRPPARNDAMLAENESYGSILFGGRDAANVPSADTWLWDGDTWAAFPPGPAPVARSAGAMARRSGNTVLLFGGLAANGAPLGDTWTHTVTGGWQPRSPLQSPASRLNHAMAGDPRTGLVWLFGGSAGSSFFGDLWHFTSTFGIDQWVPVATTPAPGPRDTHAMTCDERRGRLVLFGGRAADGSVLDDTWEFDLAAQTWTNPTPPNRPGRRMNHALVFDPLRSRCTLVGGYSPTSGYLDDIWEWDGGVWWQRYPMTRTVRTTENLAACYDRYTNRVVLFGGQISGAAPATDHTYELQEHVGPTALQAPNGSPLKVTGWPVVGAYQAPLRVETPAFGGLSALFVGIDPAPTPYAIAPTPPFCIPALLFVPGIVNFLAFGSPGVFTLNLPPAAAGMRLTFQAVELMSSGCVHATDPWQARVRSF